MTRPGGGLKVRAEVIRGSDLESTNLCQKELAELPLTRHPFRGGVELHRPPPVVLNGHRDVHGRRTKIAMRAKRS
jgi:hypothetical protein